MAQRPAEQLHVPVLLERCLDLMAPALGEDGAVAVDATMEIGRAHV